MTRISITVPFYNRLKTLEGTLDSVLGQTFTDWECILIDDGSDDGSDVLAKNFVARDPRFSYHRIEHIGSPGAVKNIGVFKSKAQWACVLDSDDLLVPETLERVCSFLDSNPGVRLFYTHWWDLYPNGKKEVAKTCSTPYSPEALLDLCLIFHLTVWDMSLFREVNGFDNVQYIYADDYDLHLRMSELSDVVEIKEPLYIYRRGFHYQVSSKHARIQAESVKALRQKALERRSSTLLDKTPNTD